MTATETEVETTRVTMVWPKDLKERVREKVGARGLTNFALEAVERHLEDADPISEAGEEVGELRHLCQLLADRVAMGGDDEMRREALMELSGLPEWFEVTGWPTEMAALVRPAQVVEPEKPAPENSEVQTPVQISEEAPAAAEGERDDLFAKVARRTGIDLEPDLKDKLKAASELEKPEAHHNHAWERTDGILCCTCGAWIDEGDPEYPQGIVRDEGWTPAVQLTVEENPPPIASEPACPKCGDELVGGECWTCA